MSQSEDTEQRGDGGYAGAVNRRKAGECSNKTSDTPRNSTPRTAEPKLLYIRNRDMIEADSDNISGEELYIAIAKIISHEHIAGLQRTGGVWRLYVHEQANTIILLAEGINVRGRTVHLHETNPFQRPPRQNNLCVKISGVPLDYHDSYIVNALESLGPEWRDLEIVGEPVREQLRVNGKLTNCLNGTRRVFVKPLEQPLPRFINIADFKARVWHVGQPNPNATCSNCLEKGHHKSQCDKPIKCKSCFEFGHSRDVCTADLSQQDASGSQVVAPETQSHKTAQETDSETKNNANEEVVSESDNYTDVDSEFEKEDSDETQLDLQNPSKNTEQEGTASGKEEDMEVSDLSVVSPREDKKRKQKKKSPERHSRRSRPRKK